MTNYTCEWLPEWQGYLFITTNGKGVEFSRLLKSMEQIPKAMEAAADYFKVKELENDS
jgi:hypothetical protein